MPWPAEQLSIGMIDLMVSSLVLNLFQSVAFAVRMQVPSWGTMMAFVPESKVAGEPSSCSILVAICEVMMT